MAAKTDRSRAREPRRNEQIRARQVRLIGSDGAALGIVERAEALARAEAEGLDLVEVGPDATPPTCRLLNYSRERFERQRAERAAQHRSAQLHHVSEVQLRPAIADHDLATKAATAERALTKGHRVKVVVVLHGRHVTRPEEADHLYERFFALLSVPYAIESRSAAGNRRVTVLRPNGHTPA